MIGSSLSHFRITAKLGEGGMGEVYRAEDTKLGREVAIKVLPEAFVADPDRLARFEREARVLASLSHPNIAGIYEVGETEVAIEGRNDDGEGTPRPRPGTAVPTQDPASAAKTTRVHYLVMELARGETLASRLERGPLRREEALGISIQIAHGLEAAHAEGVVHRDLKPGNVMVDEKGSVKVLDFGLAKALEPEQSSDAAAALAHSPTITYRATMAGALMGTAAYMSPEQARGEPADRRADIWAFAVVLWEMLTGDRLFEGRTVSDTLAEILKTEIDLAALPTSTPPAIRRLVRRCLEKDPDRRLHDVADARIVLEEVRNGVEPEAEPTTRPGAWMRAATLLAASALALGIAGGWLASRATAPEPIAEPAPTPTFRQLTRLPGGESDPSLSPDGEWFVFVKRDGGDEDIFSQRVDGTRALNLTEGCDRDDEWPAISPDGRFVAYESECGDGGIFVMGSTGENVRRVSGFGTQPAWSPDGAELAVVTENAGPPTSRNAQSELWVVRVADGTRRRVGSQDSMAPAWSPDGSRIVVWGLRGTSVQRDLWAVPVAGGEQAEAVSLVDDPAVDWAPASSADGRWVYHLSTRGGTFNLWRLPVDPASGVPRGPAEPLTAPSSWVGRFALSANGARLVYTDVNTKRVLYRAPFDPVSGTLAAEPEVVFEGSMTIRGQQLSPKGDRIVFANEEPPQQLHLIDGDGTGYRQLTIGTDRNRQGAWSPDGEWIVFQTDEESGMLAFVHPDGSGRRTFATAPHRTAAVPLWSPRGDLIAVVGDAEGSYFVNVAEGTEHPEVVGSLQTEPGRMFWPTGWSTDGSRLVGRIWHQGQRVGRPVVYDLEADAYTELGDWIGDTGTLDLRWVDEHRLVFRSGNRFLLGDLRTETTSLLYEPPEGRGLATLSVSADGRWLSWTESTDESDIWLMSLDRP